MHFINEQNSQELQISHLLRIFLFTEGDRVCRALAPAFTHKISAISTIGIRIPDGKTLPAAGLHIVGAGLLLLHSHTESAQCSQCQCQKSNQKTLFLHRIRECPGVVDFVTVPHLGWT
jgi:hypothetical protein